MPAFVVDCTEMWKHYLPDYEITILTKETYTDHIRVRPTFNLMDFILQHQADWIRAAVLMENGGIWMDASTILTDSLDFIIERVAANRTEAFGYHLDKWTTNPSIPIVENWFIATIPRGRFITAWFFEFNSALYNHATYISDLEHYYNEDTWSGIIQGIPRQGWDYLKMHIAACKIQYIHGFRILTASSIEDPHYLLEHECQWSGDNCVPLILNEYPSDKYVPRIIKFSASSHQSLENLKKMNWNIYESSIYYRYMRKEKGDSK